MSICYLSLGSNMGDRESLLRQAVDKLNDVAGIQVLRCSALYETEPVGYTEQAPFLNAVVEIKCSLSIEQLLTVCMEIEQALGRKRITRWGPRTIDIDILLFADLCVSLPHLTIPHPRISERMFVLMPLAEVNPAISWQGETVQDRIDRCPKGHGVVRLKSW
jgi:2-amino-4-hydroxy-6-hydroxymethyldihydropteridine diphosphokinase